MSDSMDTSPKARLEYLDIAKAIAIFCVVLGHTVNPDTFTKTVTYAFHMPLFFLVAGTTLKVRAHYDSAYWNTLFLKRFCSLLVPFFAWGIIYAPLDFRNLAGILYGSGQILKRVHSLGSLWFLPVMFLSVLLSELLIAASSKTKIRPEICCAILSATFFVVGYWIPNLPQMGYPWGVNIAIMATGFVLAGFSLQKTWVRLLNSRIIFSVVPFLVFLGVFCLTVRFSVGKAYTYCRMDVADYGNGLVFVSNALLASWTVLLFGVILSKIDVSKKLLLFIGRNTLGIFILHKIIARKLDRAALKIHLDYNCLAVALVIAMGSLFAALLVAKAVEFLIPQLFGKELLPKLQSRFLKKGHETAASTGLHGTPGAPANKSSLSF